MNLPTSVAERINGSFLLLAIGGSAIVLTCLIAAPAIFALAMLHPNPE